MTPQKQIVRAFEKDLKDGKMSHDELVRKWGEPFIEAWNLHEDEKHRIRTGRMKKLQTENKVLEAENKVLEARRAELEKAKMFRETYAHWVEVANGAKNETAAQSITP